MDTTLKNSITAIILAGGESTRMGQDKALLTLRGIPLLKHIYLLAKECAVCVYIITPKIDRYQSILPNECHFLREVPLSGETYPHGPLIGFAQGLTEVKTEWVLLLACDLPCLTVSEVQKWSESLDNVSEEVIAVVPRRDNRWEALCGFYRRSSLNLLNQYITQGGRSFQGWLGQHPVQELSVSNPQVLFNCNTPEDLTHVPDIDFI
ncbi:molybdopterin-guanine dinucleotide biosynthesis protein A [Gloeothece citriformis PCC 7424]|uniref:Probable molybdenum cofactor guanylyltransferase n=1 Tax=Gloeothece citriformis (strain PCC 7424) TaxID=65393 RepID=B7KEW0_GLOC7|nr:molybdenum cofactor guanylyltransferase [Gloeothece citriformis]ACK70416.1 molybdopterin-guanine dinucleotide biosynthesis protein A [Gloeothece citriformis PCC 7424]